MERRGGFASLGERLRRGIAAPSAVFAVFLAVLAEVVIFAIAIVHRNGGDLSFPLDDAFIHLAIAKHLAFAGVYGVTSQSFTAASSSIVWPWLLAGCDRVVGDHRATPIALNMVAVLGLLVTAARGLRDAGGDGESGRRVIAGTLIALAFFAPLGTLAMLGMEHTAHAWAVLALLVTTASVATDGRATASTRSFAIFALAAASTSLRYESLGIVGLCAIALVVHGRYRSAVAAGVGAVLPPAGFALYAVLHDAPPLPTSVLLKAHGGGGALGVAHVFLDNCHEAGHLVVWTLLLVGLRLALRQRSDLRTQTMLLDLIVGAAVLQLAFGRVGWFYRYEAYLVVASVYAVGQLLMVWRPKVRLPALAVGVLLLAALPLRRAVAAQAATVPAAGNVHDQQMRVAAFLQMYFPHDVAAVNDVGAVGYFREGPIVDLLGLADLDVARARGFAIDHALSRDQVTTLTAGAKVAIVYDEWFAGAIPASWTKVGSWTITDNRVCAFPTVAIYATDATNAVSQAVADEAQSRRAESGK